jgi:hypothetical protein
MKHIYHGGEPIPRGVYWNLSTGELVRCDVATDSLAGDAMACLKPRSTSWGRSSAWHLPSSCASSASP